MLLTLADDEGVILDTLEVTREDWTAAQNYSAMALEIVCSLKAGSQ